MTSLPFPVLLVAHPGFGEGLLESAESILGFRPPVDTLSNRGLGREALEEHIRRWLDAHPGPALILADVGFGSCCQAARLVARGQDKVAILAGVNLPILLAVARSHEQTDIAAFVRHVAERGRGNVEVYLGGVAR